jgi:hypothetical protein
MESIGAGVIQGAVPESAIANIKRFCKFIKEMLQMEYLSLVD